MATTQAPATAIAQAARRLHQEAKGHMRLARQHRQRAATLYAEVEQLAISCQGLGIELDLSIPIKAQGGPNGSDQGSTHTDEA